MGRLELRQLSVAYSGQDIIRCLSLRVDDGEIVSLLGPSGAGKTTILKVVAGLLPQRDGEVFINDQCVDHLPAEKRDSVLIFQKPLLFPYLDVRQNIEFGLKMSGCQRKQRLAKIEKIVDITGLQGLEQRKIHQLSGGQQQRVALARGLVLEPSILLLDEPLSSLDAELRQQMRELIRHVQQETGTTMLFVTHDQSEAFAISDRVCILLNGRLRQIGSPEDLFYRPADVDVARFFGISNILAGEVDGGKFISGPLACPADGHADGETLAVIRPEDIEMLTAPGNDNCLEATVARRQFEGTSTRLTVSTGAQDFTVLSSHPPFHEGDRIYLCFPPQRLHILPQEASTGGTP